MIYRILACIIIAGLTLYAYIDKQNELTELRIEIPSLEKEVKKTHIENRRLQFELDSQFSPEKLLELSNLPEYAHLQYPRKDTIIVME